MRILYQYSLNVVSDVYLLYKYFLIRGGVMSGNKRIYKLLYALLTVCLLLALNGCGQQEDNSLERVMDNKKLTVVGSGGYPPFNYYEGNKVVGFDVDTGAEIAKRLGVELNYVTSDWDGLTEGLRAGRYDAILGSMAITPERLKVVNFSVPYYYSGAQLVVTKDSGINEPAEMKGKTIAVVTGTNFVKDAESLGATVRLYQDDNQTLMELINGRVDGVITDRLVALGGMAKITGGDKLKLAGGLLRLEEMALAFNMNDKKLLDKVNEIISEMHSDGTLTQISKKWHKGEDITKK